MDLANLVETIEILNVNDNESTSSITQVMFNSNMSDKSYIVSDADEELLILVKFKQIINLNSIKIYSMNKQEMDIDDASPPKQVHIYKINNLNINFDDINSLKPDKSINCSLKKLSKGQNINLQKSSKNTIKFKKIQYLAIYVESNQDDSENTYINCITLKGRIDNDSNQNDEMLRKDNKQNIIKQLFDILESGNSTQIESEICDNDLNECDQLIELSKIMREYNENDNNETKNSDSICHKYSNDIVKILDYFNHFLSFHHKDHTQFMCVYKLFDASCNASNCDKVQRHYRKRGIKCNKINETKNKIFCIKEFFDRIHCHIYHAFDIGSRLTKDEQKQIDDNLVEMKNDDDNEIKAIKLRKHILNEKLLKLEKITNYNRYSKTNKFSSQLYQTKIQNDNASVSKYSYSFPFHYKQKFRDSQEVHLKWTYQDTYVPAKHDTLKNELLDNKVCCIDIDSWNIIMGTAIYLQQTQNAKKSCAETQKYVIQIKHQPNHPIHFEYIDGSSITLYHLMVLRIYCSFDEFQNKFSETYRRTKDKQGLKEIIQIHSNFHHFAKYLKEAIQVFGTEYQDGDIKRVYHGINKELVFDSTNAFVYGPLSTSYDWDIGVQFSCNTGLVIELVPDSYLKYFQCEWISSFSNEGELLFCGGFASLSFLNITNSEFGFDFNEYIKALRIIDTMTDARYFMHDPADVHTITKNNKFDVSLLKLLNISIWDKRLCLALIHHELNRNGYQHINDKPIMEFPDLDKYIEQLLHEICFNKQRISINWKTMNVDILTKCDKEWSNGGYIGYSFLRSLFCQKHYEGLYLDRIQALFPNLTNIKVFDLTSIDTNFLNEIHTFLRNKKQPEMYHFDLNISKEFEHSNIAEQCNMFKSKFKNIGFGIRDMKNEAYQTERIVIMQPRKSQKKSKLT